MAILEDPPNGLVAPLELDPVGQAVAPLVERWDLGRCLEPFATLRWDGSGPLGPVLHLDDVSAIPFLVDIAGVEEYQHRARLRAGDGDLFATVTPPTPGYETYCRQRLGLGEAELVLATPTDGPLAVARACGAGQARRRIVDRARGAGGLTLHPYMGIEEAWELAARLTVDAEVPVSVIAPPPPVTWIANDKAAFSAVVERLLGPGWLVETFVATDPAALARHLGELADRHRRVGLKRLRCASAMGNIVFDAARLRSLERPAVEAEVRSFLARTEWDGLEEVQAVAWEETDLSPSTQLWIPPAGKGEPILDGVYEQILEGDARVFVGSRPSTLPGAVNTALGAVSLRVAAGLQALGYVGRCSFDFLLLGEPAGEPRLLFTECNGRWGGTSTPMALLDRLLGAPRPPYRAQDLVHPGLVGATFTDLLEAVGDEVFDAATRQGRYLFYNVGPLAGAGKLDVIALGRTQQEAEEALLEHLPRRLQL